MKISKRLLPIFALLVSLLALAACGPAEHDDAERRDQVHESEPAEAPSSTETPSSWEVGGLRIYAMTDSPELSGARLAMSSPEPGGAVANGSVPFAFGVEGYELGVQTSDAAGKGLANSADGQHIHLILNNGPYSAHYEPAFDKELETGHYVVLAFLSRSYHESVKSPGAAVVTQLTVGDVDPGELAEADLSAPHLFYSRPKGSYKGADTEKLMLDFYLVNTDLAPDGNKVRATINGNQVIFSEWVPYVIEGLPMGEVEIQLELIDASGQPIPGPFNNVTRTVTLEPADE